MFVHQPPRILAISAYQFFCFTERMVQLEPLWILLGQDKHWIVCMWRNAGGYTLAHPGVEKKNPQGPQGSEVEEPWQPCWKGASVDPVEIQESWSIMKRHEASWDIVGLLPIALWWSTVWDPSGFTMILTRSGNHLQPLHT